MGSRPWLPNSAAGLSVQMCKAGPVKWSASRPKPGMFAIYPQPDAAKLHLDLHGISWFGALDMDLTRDRVHSGKVLTRNIGDCGPGGELSDRTDAARAQDGRPRVGPDGGGQTVPAEMMLRAVDGLIAVLAHRVWALWSVRGQGQGSTAGGRSVTGGGNS